MFHLLMVRIWFMNDNFKASIMLDYTSLFLQEKKENNKITSLGDKESIIQKRQYSFDQIPSFLMLPTASGCSSLPLSGKATVFRKEMMLCMLGISRLRAKGYSTWYTQVTLQKRTVFNPYNIDQVSNQNFR